MAAVAAVVLNNATTRTNNSTAAAHDQTLYYYATNLSTTTNNFLADGNFRSSSNEVPISLFSTTNSSTTINTTLCIPPGADGWTWDKLLIALIGTPMSFCTFLFNFITLLAFLKHRELRGEPSNWYIIHLAFCDMFTGLHSMPSTMIADIFPCYPFPLWVCRIDRFLIWLVPQQSGTLVDLIAYDRMLMIIYGANYARRETMRVVQWKIAASWLYNLIVFGLPNFLYLVTGQSLSGDGVCIEEIFQIAWFSGLIGIISAMVPTLICGVIYVSSAYLLKKRTETLAQAANSITATKPGILLPPPAISVKKIKNSSSSSLSTSAVVMATDSKPRPNASARAREKREVAKRKRAFRFMAFMATAFLVCWFPSGIMIIIYTFTCTDNQDMCKQNGMRSILQATFYLFLSNSIIDPILYPFLMPKFRKLTIRMLTCGRRSYLFKPSDNIGNKQPAAAAAAAGGGGSGKLNKRSGGRASGARVSGGGGKGGKPASNSRSLLTSSSTRRAVAGVAAARLASPEKFGIRDRYGSGGTLQQHRRKKSILTHIDSDDTVRKVQLEKEDEEERQRRRYSAALSSDGINREGDDEDEEEDDEQGEEYSDDDFDDDLTPDNFTSPPADKIEVVWRRRRSHSLEQLRSKKKNGKMLSKSRSPVGGLSRRTGNNKSPSHDRFLSCIPRPNGGGGQSTTNIDIDVASLSYANGASPMIVELHTLSTMS